MPEDLLYQNCCKCGVRHAIPKATREWMCPNGHSLKRGDPTELERLRDEVKSLQSRGDHYWGMYLKMERLRNAQKSATSRLRNKLKALTMEDV